MHNASRNLLFVVQYNMNIVTDSRVALRRDDVIWRSQKKSVTRRVIIVEIKSYYTDKIKVLILLI